MTDEPYTNGDGDVEMQSGVPVRLYQGGYNGCPTLRVPCADTGNDGDVLTLDNGVAIWQEPAGGSLWNTEISLPANNWLSPGWPFLTPFELAYSYNAFDDFIGSVPQTSSLLGSYATNVSSVDTWTIGTGTGTSISVAFPTTTNGQRLSTTRAGYSASYLKPFITNFHAEWRVAITWTGATTTGTWRLLNGSSPDTDANAYASGGISGNGSSTITVPSAINSTSSNPTAPRFIATLADSRTWTVSIRRVSVP